jgi:hypothetical protein
VQRLDAVRVAGRERAALVCVPDDERDILATGQGPPRPSSGSRLCPPPPAVANSAPNSAASSSRSSRCCRSPVEGEQVPVAEGGSGLWLSATSRRQLVCVHDAGADHPTPVPSGPRWCSDQCRDRVTLVRVAVRADGEQSHMAVILPRTGAVWSRTWTIGRPGRTARRTA